MNSTYDFSEFCGIIKTLRSENGCPWDREQTHTSLKQCLIEEAYEVLEGIDEYERTKDYDNMREELGDVLLQVVMQSEIAKEEGLFGIDDVIDEIAKKMVRRHPHVFSDVEVADTNGVLENWEKIKKQEKQKKSQKDCLSAIPSAFPALIRASKVAKKSDKLYGQQTTVLSSENAYEILSNLQENTQNDNSAINEDEIGAILYYICQLTSRAGLNSEKCLSEYVKKYILDKEK